MKILILYTYNKGLLSNFFQELSEKLQSDGDEVFNFYLKHKREDFDQNGVHIFGEKRTNTFTDIMSIFKCIYRIKPDLVVSNFSYVNPAILSGKFLNVKKNIAWFHSANGYTKPSIFKVFNKSIYLKMADIVIANSPQLQKELNSIYNINKNRTRAVPFWTNINQYKSSSLPLVVDKKSNVFKIGCPGRLEFEKNQHGVIESVFQLKLRFSKSITLYLAGAGSYRRELEDLVSQFKLTVDVVFLGALNVNEMVTFYNEMDLIVLPSFHDAFGLVFIESLALGRPTLVSSKFGALDFIDASKFNVEDFSFDPNKETDLTEKINHFILSGGFGSTFYKRIYDETYDKEVIYQEIKSIFTQ